MNGIRFLLDENLVQWLGDALRRREPRVEVLWVGAPGAPAKETKDPELLLWIEAHQWMLLTGNRKSMPGHLADHLAAGHHVPGIFLISDWLPIRQVVDELLLIWGASTPDEWQDRIWYLPLFSK